MNLKLFLLFLYLEICLADDSLYPLSPRSHMLLQATVKWAVALFFLAVLLINNINCNYWFNKFVPFQLITSKHLCFKLTMMVNFLGYIKFVPLQLIAANTFVLNSQWWLIFLGISVLIEPKIHLSTAYKSIITIGVSENMNHWKLVLFVRSCDYYMRTILLGVLFKKHDIPNCWKLVFTTVAFHSYLSC